MRINRFIARSTGMSRRSADKAVEQGRVAVNGKLARHGDEATASEQVTLDGIPVSPASDALTLILNKPSGYVCSRDGQGSHTIYELLPDQLQTLKPAGRLDKDSSGLLMLTNDGKLANRLTHPSYKKEKRYEVKLDQPLAAEYEEAIKQGLQLEDGVSKLNLKPLNKQRTFWEVKMSEGRNRQIRRTFGLLGFKITSLHRTRFGEYTLNGIAPGEIQKIGK